jgi:MFS family permease
MESLRTYRELLRNGPLARLLIGEFVSSIGDWLYLVALVVLVYRETQDPVILGIVGAARMLPYILLSIPAGIITDRFDRRLVLLTSDIARGLCMLVMAGLVFVDGPLWAIGAVAILAACFSTFFYPAIGALLPSLARDEREFGPANSAWATLDNFAWIVGPAIAGLLLATGELTLAFLLNAATFGIIAVVLWSLPRAVPLTAPSTQAPAGSGDEPGDEPGNEPGGAHADAASAIPPGLGPQGAIPTSGSWASALAPGRWLRPRVPHGINLAAVTGVTVVSSVTWFAFGGISILIVVIATDVFNGGDAATGYLNGAIGIGGTIGALLSGALVLRPSLGRVLLIGSVAFGAASLLLGIADSLLVAFVAITLASVGNLVTDVTGTTIFQRAVPDAYRGRLGGVMMTGQTASEALGTLVVPILVSVFGFAPVLGLTGALVIGLTLVAVALIGKSADVAPGPYDTDLKRIARLPLFGGLSPARVEQALRRLDPVDARAGDVILRQGDPADRFYVICGGSFAVTQAAEVGGEPRLLRTLTQDDVFGERGIIAGAPRAATITAATDGRLFTMDGADFLELVGGRKGMAERFLALYESPTESRGRA